MNSKRILALIVAVAMLLLCSACGKKPETAQEVMAKVQSALDENTASQIGISMEMDATVDLGSYGSMNFNVKNSTDSSICVEPYSSHSIMDTTITYGEDLDPTVSNIESYSVVEDGEIVNYVCSDDTWTRSATGLTVVDVTSTSEMLIIDDENAAIDTSVSEYNGDKVICLTTTATGTELQEALTATFNDSSLIDYLDLSTLTCDAKLYVSAATYLPVAEELNITGAGDMLTTLFASILGEGITVDVPNFKAVITIASYEAQDEIKVPQEVIDNASELDITAAEEIIGTEENEIASEIETEEGIESNSASAVQ